MWQNGKFLQHNHVANASAHWFPNFKRISQSFFPLNSEHSIQQFLQNCQRGSRICHRTLTNGGIFWDENSAKESNLEAHDCWINGTPGEILHFGIPREPDDFIKDALAKGHPRDIVAEEIFRITKGRRRTSQTTSEPLAADTERQTPPVDQRDSHRSEVPWPWSRG